MVYTPTPRVKEMADSPELKRIMEVAEEEYSQKSSKKAKLANGLSSDTTTSNCDSLQNYDISQPPSSKPFRNQNASEQQKEIVQLAQHREKKNPYIVEITAAAGTGKTTTLEYLSCELLKKGHKPKDIEYITFNKTAVADAKKRLGNHVHASTIHSSAFKVMDINYSNSKPMDDSDLDLKIVVYCSDNIDQFLYVMPSASKKEKEVRKSAYKTIVTYIRKTVQTFLRSRMTVEVGLNPDTFGTIYYPALKWHDGGKTLPRALLGIREYDIKKFYTENAKMIWSKMDTQSDSGLTPILTFDSVLKRAQLSKKKIPCTAILLDESQDLNECQVDFMCIQVVFHGTQLYAVGDPAQAIYGFQGSKSKNMMDIKVHYPNVGIIKCKLTQSFRFGPNIAAVANTILFSKENSPQTTNYVKEKAPSWHPYRIEGKGGQGEVTTRSLIGEIFNPSGRRQPVTVIAYTNIELFQFAITLILSEPIGVRGIDGEEERTVKKEGSKSGESVTKGSEKGGKILPVLPSFNFKIALNGKGESSGRKKWVKEKANLLKFFAIFTGASETLDIYPWKDVEYLTWGQVCLDIDLQELDQHNTMKEFIDKYETKSLEVYHLFEINVLDKNHPSEDADIILSTIHAAKGMEWDRVIVLDSNLIDLAKFKIITPTITPSNSSSSPSPKPKPFQNANQFFQERWNRNIAQIDYLDYGDEVNLWYVAVTRAKKVLSLPPKFMKLVMDLRNLNDYVTRSLGLRSVVPMAPVIPMVTDLNRTDEIITACVNMVTQNLEGAQLSQGSQISQLSQTQISQLTISQSSQGSYGSRKELVMAEVDEGDEPFLLYYKEGCYYSDQELLVINRLAASLKNELTMSGNLIIDGMNIFR